jgi:hypothetical protein
MSKRSDREVESEPLFGPESSIDAPSGPLQPATGRTDVQLLLDLGAEAVAKITTRRVGKKLGAPRQLPFSKQFTPVQVPSLGAFLSAVSAADRNKDDVQDAAFRLLHPNADQQQDPQKWTMAYNALRAAYYYGLASEDLDGLTPFGKAILDLADDPARAVAMARHILHHLNGVELVQGIAALARAGQRPNKMSLASHFAGQGLASNADGTDINAIGGWLKIAGVYRATGWYDLDEGRFTELAGLDVDTAHMAAALDAESQAILEQLALAPHHTSTTGEIVKLLKPRTDLQVDVPGFKKTHLDPLAKAGLITIEKATPGRGGAATRFTGTDLFGQRVVQTLLEQIRTHGFTVSGPDLQVPFAELVNRLRDLSLSRDERGRALELFALRLLRRLGLTDIRLRVRPTAAEEIDATAEGFAPVHARWQIQCKNSRALDVDHAAKEVGVAVRNRSTIILLLTTGVFTRPADNYVDEVVRSTPYTVVRLDGADVDTLSADETRIVDLLRREAGRAQRLRAETHRPLPIPSGGSEEST